MSENAGVDPRVAAAEQAATQDATGAPDEQQVVADAGGEPGSSGAVDANQIVDEPDGRT